jgi:hypothetical protein
MLFITLTNLIDHYNFAVDLSNAGNALMYGSPTAIPFPTAFVSDALTWTAYYRTVNTTTEFQDMLDIIEGDITKCEGLTKAQIWALY